MREIVLTDGSVALVDDEDFALVSGRPWRPIEGANTVYAVASFWIGGRTKKIRMHRLITGVQRGVLIDHWDGNGLHNFRSNLREATKRQNSFNAISHKDGSSRFKGVSWFPRDQKWCARVTLSGKYKNLGYFSSEEDAARAVDAAAREHHGEFGRFNFPMPGEFGAARAA